MDQTRKELYSRDIEKSKQKLKKARKDSQNTNRHIEKYNKQSNIEKMTEQIKTSVKNYFLNNPEVEIQKLAQGVADLIQSEMVKINKTEGLVSQTDFNINTFIDKQSKKSTLQQTPETTDGELEVSTGASSGATLPKRIKHRNSSESTLNMTGED